MIGRLGRYVLGSYPPLLSTVLAVCWAYGLTGLFAAVDPHPGTWWPDAGTAVGAVTIVLDMLLMRVIDDIRDLDYDRARSPGRPLPSRVVSVTDLMILYAVLAPAIVLLNWGRGPATVIVAAQLCYALLLLAADRWLRWPDTGNLVLTLALTCPVQFLLHGYLYAGYLRSAGHPADGSLIAALAVVLAVSVHLELAKNLIRQPAPGERSYVNTFGLPGTVWAVTLSPLIAAGLLLAFVRPWSPWALLVLAPLALPAAAWWTFRRSQANRWNGRYALYYLLLTFVAFAVIGAATGR